MKFIVSILLILPSSFLFAQNNIHFTVHQDEKFTDLLRLYTAYNETNDLADGYRLQVKFSDNRDEIYKDKATVYRNFPDVHCYVEYEQPYYKLRLGDFRTRLEATGYLNLILPTYSSAFIVKDRVKVK